jgi:hypothetical protein
MYLIYYNFVTDVNTKIKKSTLFFFSLAQQSPVAWASSVTRFLDSTQRRTTVGRTPLNE